jgi:CheY-like chemotaxis protein
MNSLNTPVAPSLFTALVVDDDTFSQAVAQRALHKLGIDACEMACDGAEGLRMLARNQPAPDLIICDIYMPNKDGIEFLDALAKLQYEGLVVLTSGGQQLMLEVAERLASFGGLNVTGKITKPLDHQQLAMALGLSPVA